MSPGRATPSLHHAPRAKLQRTDPGSSPLNLRGILFKRSGPALSLFQTIEHKPESLAKMTDQQQADLFRTMCAYGGTYQFDGESVEHHIDISWNEIWTGTTVVKFVKKDGDKLIYTQPAAPFGSDGRMSLVTVVWEKL